MDKLIWDIGSGEIIPARSQFWSKVVGPIPQGLQTVGHIDHRHSNGNQRWKDIKKQASFIMDKLFWDIESGEIVPLKSQFWWKVVRPIPQGLQTINQLRNNEGF